MLGSLSEYVDGSLGQSICDEIERHLAECDDCKVIVDTLKKTVYLVRSTAEEPDVPEDVRDRLYRTLNLEEYLKKS